MRTLLSWSSGKDSAWALHQLQTSYNTEVVALVTTISEDVGRVAMHATRRKLLQRQAKAAGLPLIEVLIPRPCSNQQYQHCFGNALKSAAQRFQVNHIAFGDLFLTDIRQYREQQMTALDFKPIFPLWGLDTTQLANDMINAGQKAQLTCIDPKQMPQALAGRAFDHQLLEELPSHVDPCGENGEFHSFCWSSPAFKTDIAIITGDTVERDGFIFTDLLEATNP